MTILVLILAIFMQRRRSAYRSMRLTSLQLNRDDMKKCCISGNVIEDQRPQFQFEQLVLNGRLESITEQGNCISKEARRIVGFLCHFQRSEPRGARLANKSGSLINNLTRVSHYSNKFIKGAQRCPRRLTNFLSALLSFVSITGVTDKFRFFLLSCSTSQSHKPPRSTEHGLPFYFNWNLTS